MCLETPELIKLDAQVANAYEWADRVEQSMDSEIALRDLEKLVNSGKQLPVNFGKKYEALCKRYQDAKGLEKRIQATYKMKSTRNSAQVGDEN